jgi:GNAT superfamily N-acetyltransferase
MEQPKPVSIRPATPADARSVAEVHVASWRDAYRGMLPDAYLSRLSVDDREAMWREAFADPSSGAFVAESSGRIVGFVSFGPSRDDDAGEEVGEIPAIYLQPREVGTGVGRGLFEAATEALRRAGYRRATLWVLEANERARRF